ncbi:hypothetical protein SBA7_490009 [Candidatus Sulfotelmatobacter sp. SbA7]|nr:hypothetical protein SBA7_490009 [Candidatus Sulfotelmatobacter sp. SbA7]
MGGTPDGLEWGEVRGLRSEVRLKRFGFTSAIPLTNRRYSGTHSSGTKNATIDSTVATP